MADPVNPYAPSGLDRLSMLLMSLGSGISGAEASGRSGWAGLGPAAAMYGGAMANANQNAAAWEQQQRQFQSQEAYRKLQEEDIRSRVDERKRMAGLEERLMGMVPGLMQPPGMGVPPSAPTMGPGGDYFSVTGTAETGGSANPYRQPNLKGSGAYGKYQFTPDTWASVATQNPQLGLPFNMRQSTDEQQEAAMRALTESNARALSAAGITPTKGNLYLAHRFGAEGAKTVMRAPPGTAISSLFPPIWTEQNPDMRGATVDQFRQRADSRFGGAPQMPGPPPDPSRYAPLALSPRLAPVGTILQNRDKAQYDYGWKTYDAQRDQMNKDRDFGMSVRKTEGDERNQKVGPNGPNTALIDAETEAARRRAAAESDVKLETEAALNLSKDEMKRYSTDIRPGVESAASSLPNLYEMKRLAAGPIAAGPFMDTRMLAARTADWLGLAGISDPMVNRTEFNNRAAKNVLAILQTRALGAGSGISNVDREFVEKMAGSGGGFSQKELQRIIDIGIKAQQSVLAQHDQTVGRMRKLPGAGKIDEGYFKIEAPSYDAWAKANPPLGASSPAGNTLDEEMRRRGLLGRNTPAANDNPLDAEMRRRGLR